MHKAEIASAEIGIGFLLGSGQLRAEGGDGFIRSIPVPKRDAWPSQPDLTDLAVGQLRVRIWINDP